MQGCVACRGGVSCSVCNAGLIRFVCAQRLWRVRGRGGVQKNVCGRPFSAAPRQYSTIDAVHRHGLNIYSARRVEYIVVS